ncbi:hypothetical protein ACIQ2D_09765 [Lysinibacillus sp. NPDC097287]|uniref:hypothetical protein n=1 Tax=Lysinibacillus sp. NPDC097287 TaxID=3364144 RepID=UPI00380BD061
MLKKRLVRIILFCILLFTLFSVETIAKTTDSVEVDVCIIGGDNHFVYKIPKQLHNSTAYDEMKVNIEQSLSSQWEIQTAHYEVNNSVVEYTFFIEDLFQLKKKGQIQLEIPYSILIGMFGEDEAIQLRIMASKLTDWTVNAKEWATFGFVQPLTFFSESEYVYEGPVNELLQQRIGNFDGSIDKVQMLVRSVIYISFILLQVMTCLFLAGRLKKRLLQCPEEMHQYRKLSYTYQLIPVLIIIAQIIFVVMSGLLTAFGLYFRPGIDLLLIVTPVLLSIIVMPMVFVATENKVSKESWENMDVISPERN